MIIAVNIEKEEDLRTKMPFYHVKVEARNQAKQQDLKGGIVFDSTLKIVTYIHWSNK